MSWHRRFKLPDNVAVPERRRRQGALAAPVPLRRGGESEVQGALKGLARSHGLTVGEVARNLESGLWSKDHCLGSLRLQLAFEQMCDDGRFSDAAAKEPRKLPADQKGPRAA